jgi:hypothetical protein
MSNVVDFLEALSLDARALSEAEYLDVVAAAGFDADTRRALQERDAGGLSRLLGARTNVMALVFPAEDEPNDEPTPDPDREPKEGDHELHTDALAA